MSESTGTNGSSSSSSDSLALQLRTLEDTILLQRAQWMRQVGLAFGDKRDYYSVLGYDRTLSAAQFRETYLRGGIAKGVVEAYPKATWRGGVEIYEDEDPDKKTAFEIACSDLITRLKVWRIFERADILAGLSTYSVILLGDGTNVETPLPKGDGTPKKLVYLQPYFGGGGPGGSSPRASATDVDATIAEFDVDSKSPRFGEPLFYSLKRQNMAMPTEFHKVHWSRIIHVAEGCLDDNVYGIPTLENVWNLIQDLLKVTGGGSEAYWLRAHRILHANIDKDMQLSSADNTLTKLGEELDKINHNLSSMARTRGVDLNTITSDVANFGPSADAILKQIAGSKGIPARILTGSEMGELASSQDAENWNSRVQDRRTSHAEPNIVRQFFDRLIEFNYLPAPAKPYSVGWPVEEEMTEPEKADLAVKLATANSTNGDVLFTDAEIREKTYDMKPLTDAQRKEIDDRAAEKVKQAQEAMAKPEDNEDEKPSKDNVVRGTFPRAAEAADDELVGVLRAAIEAGATEVVHAIVGLGGPGSGNFGHAGRPGAVGGSTSAAKLGASLESSVNYYKGVFYSNRETTEDILKQVQVTNPRAVIIKGKRGFLIQDGIYAFGPNGWTLPG